MKQWYSKEGYASEKYLSIPVAGNAMQGHCYVQIQLWRVCYAFYVFSASTIPWWQKGKYSIKNRKQMLKMIQNNAK